MMSQSYRKTVSIFVWLFFLCMLTKVYGQIYNIQDAADMLGARFSWDALSGAGILEKDGHTITFQRGVQVVLLDYRNFSIIKSPELQDGSLVVGQDFVDVAMELFNFNEEIQYYRIGAILIDPGHGGKEPCAWREYTSDGKIKRIQENDINLSVSLDLRDRLKKNYPDKNILITRDDDSYLTLEERVEIANSVALEPHEAILYISIHVNASLDKKANGFEVWYLSPGYRRNLLQAQDDIDTDLLPILNSMLEEEYTTESILIAKFILDGMEKSVGDLSPSRGIKEEEWFVVRNANMPSVLVEVGFLSNQEEAARLADEAYLRKLSEGIYNGLAAFITHFERSGGFTGAS